jgi:hypothetical protein
VVIVVVKDPVGEHGCRIAFGGTRNSELGTRNSELGKLPPTAA